MNMRLAVMPLMLSLVFVPARVEGQLISIGPGATASVWATCGDEDVWFRVQYPRGLHLTMPRLSPSTEVPPETSASVSPTGFRAQGSVPVKFYGIDRSEILLRNERGFVAVMKPVGMADGPAYAREVPQMNGLRAVAIEWGTIALGNGLGQCLDGDLARMVLGEEEAVRLAVVQRVLADLGVYSG